MLTNARVHETEAFVGVKPIWTAAQKPAVHAAAGRPLVAWVGTAQVYRYLEQRERTHHQSSDPFSCRYGFQVHASLLDGSEGWSNHGPGAVWLINDR